MKHQNLCIQGSLIVFQLCGIFRFHNKFSKSLYVTLTWRHCKKRHWLVFGKRVSFSPLGETNNGISQCLLGWWWLVEYDSPTWELVGKAFLYKARRYEFNVWLNHAEGSSWKLYCCLRFCGLLGNLFLYISGGWDKISHVLLKIS